MWSKPGLLSQKPLVYFLAIHNLYHCILISHIFLCISCVKSSVEAMSARVLQRSYLSDGSLLGLALSWNPGSGGGRLTTWMLTAKYAPQMTPDEAQTSLISDSKDTEVAMDVFAASDYGVLVALPFLGGVLTHQGLFRRYQLDRYPLMVASAFVFLQFALFKALQLPYGADASSRYSVAIVTFASFFSGLCLSTIVHRAVFHPLKKFPGPFPARLSKFWGVYKTAGTRIKWYKFSRDLHAKYGDYVRIGAFMNIPGTPFASILILARPTRTLNNGSGSDCSSPRSRV